MNVIPGPFNGTNPQKEKTPLEMLLGHTAYVERKRQEADRGKEHLPPNGAPVGMKAVRLDQDGDDQPVRVLLIGMEGSRPSLLVAGTDLSTSHDSCITMHDGKQLSAKEDGAVGIHLSSNMALRLAAEVIEMMMPRFTPPVAFAANKFLEAIRTKEEDEKSPIIN